MLSHRPAHTSSTLIPITALCPHLALSFSFCLSSLCHLLSLTHWGSLHLMHNTLNSSQRLRDDGSICPLCSIAKVITICWSALLVRRLSGYGVKQRIPLTQRAELHLDSVTWTLNVMKSFSMVPQWLCKSPSTSLRKSHNWPQRWKRSNQARDDSRAMDHTHSL